MEKLVTPSIGRITGSASIDTLVRVGLEKEHGLSENSKVVVLHDFTPQVDDELGVKRGDIVHILYEEHDWVSSLVATFNEESSEVILIHHQRVSRSVNDVFCRQQSSDVGLCRSSSSLMSLFDALFV